MTIFFAHFHSAQDAFFYGDEGVANRRHYLDVDRIAFVGYIFCVDFFVDFFLRLRRFIRRLVMNVGMRRLDFLDAARDSVPHSRTHA